MVSEADDNLPISALQHWLFCPRQCALIHVERLWAENALTAEGRILHTRADAGGRERRGALRTLRGVQLGSRRLGLHGVADVVEMHGAVPCPVEYKRGRPKPHRADEVQLCAQAICLEEMLGRDVPEGALFFGQTRRRQRIVFDAGLRCLTERVVMEARAALGAGALPPPVEDQRKCRACSLATLCRPERMRTTPRTATWLARGVASDAVPE